MSYTCQMSGGGGSPPDKFYKMPDLTKIGYNENLQLVSLKEEDNSLLNFIKLENEKNSAIREENLKKENEKKTTLLFLLAHSDPESIIKFLPKEIVLTILFDKTFIQNNIFGNFFYQASPLQTTDKTEIVSFIPLKLEFETLPKNFDFIKNLEISKSDFSELMVKVEPKANDSWCQIQ